MHWYRGKYIRLRHAILAVIASVFVTGGCYAEITGTVVDAETGQPIEEAVVLVEWTKTKGLPGLSYTKPYDVFETVSKKNGSFTIKKILNPLVNPPRITIYRKGYVAWNNEYIFPGWIKRDNFKLADGMIIKLEHFKKEYSRDDHVSFLHGITHWGRIINEAYRWEELEKELKK